MNNCSSVVNHSQIDLSKKTRSNNSSLLNQNTVTNSQIYNDQHSNVAFHQTTNKHQRIPPPSLTNMQLVCSPSSSIRRAHSSEDSDDDFHLVMNKKKKKRKQKQTTFSPLQQLNDIPILNNNSPQNGNQINNAEQHH
ncbi:unnamed protein product, partial [Rotaria sp. Silwood2]